MRLWARLRAVVGNIYSPVMATRKRHWTDVTGCLRDCIGDTVTLVGRMLAKLAWWGSLAYASCELWRCYARDQWWNANYRNSMCGKDRCIPLVGFFFIPLLAVRQRWNFFTFMALWANHALEGSERKGHCNGTKRSHHYGCCDGCWLAWYQRHIAFSYCFSNKI